MRTGIARMTSRVFAVAAATAAAIVAVALAGSPARAEIEYPWCSITSIGQSGMPACMYSTIEQCNAFIGGQAGFCQPNPRYVAAAPAQGKRRGRR
jgi:hypothetical protein